MTKTRFDILSKGLRRKRGEMNRNETRYAEYLDSLEGMHRYWFEPLSLRISHPEKGQGARVTPDFLVLMEDGTTYMDDVKSPVADNASIVRMKAAAELFPLWIFRTVVPIAKKRGGGWDIREL